MHNALEISIPLDNHVKYPLGDNWYHAAQGDVFLLRPFEPHWNLTQDEDKPGRWLMLLFLPSVAAAFLPEGASLLTPFYTFGMSPLIPASSTHAQEIVRLSLAAIEEGELKRTGWRLQQQTQLLQILLTICRYYEEQVHSSNPSDATSWNGIVRSIEFMMANWAEEMNMDDVISLSGLRKTWFYTRFKEITCLSPNEFLIRLRLQYAGDLLLNTTQSITTIALQCGFSSPSYFNKVFKEHRGMPPREFRQTSRNV
jgi:AraC-like DNA-binding protein